MTEDQGLKVIELLEDILWELKNGSIQTNLETIQRDIGSIQLDVASIDANQ